ncbi:MAG: hypothetical protein ACOCXA_06005, partial [Planctomycetota bacterium]
RQARSSLLAKSALSGAWALRVDFNRPLFDSDLSGAVGEVNDRLRRQAGGADLTDAGEDYDVDRWRELYGAVFEGGRLSPEALFVAGSSYLGFVLRDGDLPKAQAVIERLDKRYADMDGQLGIKLRSLVRDRSLMLKDYLLLLRGSATYHVQAIQAEEIARQRLPTTVMAVAESLRRSGSHQEAWDWYWCLANMEETQQSLRKHIRSQGGVPDVTAGMPVQLGWMADNMMTRLQQRHGVVAAEEPTTGYAGVVNAIVYGGLGTPDFASPSWQPTTEADLADAQAQLDRLGKTLLNYHLRRGGWPERLADLWTEGVLPDWNAVNRFHCPATGAPYRYQAPAAAELGQRVVLISTSKPVRTREGLRFGAYLLDNSLFWSATSLEPGARP